MAENSKIEWTDATWNPITGCSVLTPGCTNCYAMKLAGTRLRNHPSRAGLTKHTKTGPVWTGEVRFNEGWLTQPLQWRRPRMVFVCAHGDLFHEDVPDEWIDKVVAIMGMAPHHTFQVLTKRSDRMRRYISDRTRRNTVELAAEKIQPGTGFMAPKHTFAWPLPNVWLGVSAERQKEAEERIPMLLITPAATRFVSLEPLLGPITLGVPETEVGPISWLKGFDGSDPPIAPIDWVIVGGESGDGARPMHPDWARSLRDQCTAAGKLDRFFFKQWGAWRPSGGWINGHLEHGTHGISATTGKVARAGDLMCGNVTGSEWSGYGIIRNVGKKAAGRLLEGVEHNGMPK